MTLTNIPLDIQNLLILDYENRIKSVLLVGWFILSLFYLLFWYKSQKPTKLFILGTFRASMYVTSWLYSWLFWLIYPVYTHPNVPIDNLLIFLGGSYTALSTVFFVILMFNFTVWIPKFLIKFGKIEVNGFEAHAIKAYFGDGNFTKWLKKR